MAGDDGNFKFKEVATKAVNVIDSIRSRGKSGSRLQVESRMGAFYRALGLPAVSGNQENDERDPLGVDNVFGSDDLDIKNFKSALDIRKAICFLPVNIDDRNNFLYHHTKKPSDGLKSDDDATVHTPSGRTGALFPFVANGDSDIYPQNRRVRGAFFEDKDLTIGGVKYSRPLIETIILMKLKGEGVSNSSTTAVIGQGGPLSALIDDLTKNLEKSILSIPRLISKANLELERSTVETKINILPSACNIAEENPESEIINDDHPGALDKTMSEQKQVSALNTAMLSLFEFDDNIGNGVNNMRAGLLASEVLLSSAAVQDSELAEINTEEAEAKQELAKKKIKEAFQILDLSLGTFSGISGIDILIIITSLMKMSVSDLLGLINEDALKRLRVMKGKSIAPVVSEVNFALGKLTENVEEMFKTLEAVLKIASASGS